MEGGPGSCSEPARALPRSLVRARGRTPGCTLALSVRSAAWKQSLGRQHATPREVLLDDCADQPGLVPRPIAEPGKGKGVDAGPRSWSQPNVWEEARKEFGEGMEGWEHFRTEDRELGRATTPQSPDLAMGEGAQVEGRVNEYAKAETKQNMEGNLFRELVRVRTIELGDSN